MKKLILSLLILSLISIGSVTGQRISAQDKGEPSAGERKFLD